MHMAYLLSREGRCDHSGGLRVAYVSHAIEIEACEWLRLVLDSLETRAGGFAGCGLGLAVCGPVLLTAPPKNRPTGTYTISTCTVTSTRQPQENFTSIFSGLVPKSVLRRGGRSLQRTSSSLPLALIMLLMPVLLAMVHIASVVHYAVRL